MAVTATSCNRSRADVTALTLTHSPETVFETDDHRAAVVGIARDAVSGWLRRHDANDDLQQALVLITSELVTNAARETSGVVRVTLGEVLGGVKLQVFDEGIDLPAARAATSDESSGRGLAIVEALADAWGTHHALTKDAAKVVWATCRRR